MINAGQMTERVTLQSPSSSKDGLGQRIEGWVDYVTVWAKVEPIRGREFFAAGEMQAEAAVRVTIRYRADIGRTMRVLWRGVPHAIVADPIDINAQKWALELMCSAGIRDSR